MNFTFVKERVRLLLLGHVQNLAEVVPGHKIWLSQHDVVNQIILVDRAIKVLLRFVTDAPHAFERIHREIIVTVRGQPRFLGGHLDPVGNGVERADPFLERLLVGIPLAADADELESGHLDEGWRLLGAIDVLFLFSPLVFWFWRSHVVGRLTQCLIGNG